MLKMEFTLLAVLAFTIPVLADWDEGDLTVTVVYDNYPFNKDLETKWGFSCLVEGAEKTILFDTGGDGKVLLRNMKKLGIKPEAIEIMVFSHIHQDHTGGAADFLKENSAVTVYMLKSFTESFRDMVSNSGAQYVDVQKPVKICEDVFCTGEIGTQIKEEALAIKTAKGLVVITGCAHPGIVEMVRKAKEVFKEEAVHLVVGGFHLGQMREEQIKGIIAELRGENVEKIAPTHCTGDRAIAMFKAEYGDDFISAGVGKKIKIERAFPEE
jgi:7,8-dihydropterin-6-yl-methyl-4-(beta-D-ribofuranosyl)aminobenzene 5'-phosphate synthase